MSPEAFDNLVRRLEADAAKNPAAYRFWVALLAALGFAFVYLLIAALLSLLAAAVFVVAFAHLTSLAAGKILIVLFGTAVMLLRSLQIKFRAPDGVPLRRTDAEPFFALVDRLTHEIGAPRFHHLVLTADMNAGVAQVPRLGVLGWQRNYLVLGLPLMQSLDEGQFEAVLAHELGHLSSGHGRFGGWVYRVFRTYANLSESLRRSRLGLSLLDSFLQWYVPYFAACSFALRRQNEYEADACAARTVGASVFADALCALPIRARAAESFWVEIIKGAEARPEPPDDTLDQLGRAFYADTLSDTADVLGFALCETTGTADTHPSLSDRLRALGEDAYVPESAEQSAADRLFGANLPTLTAQVSAHWRLSSLAGWERKHRLSVAARNDFDQLEAKAAAGDVLTTDEAWRRANRTETFRGADAAVLRYLHVAQSEDPEYAPRAYFSLGRILLSRDAEEGIGYLETAYAADPALTYPALELVYQFNKRRGNADTAYAGYRRTRDTAETERRARAERIAPVSPSDAYLPHDVAPEQVAALTAQFGAYSDVERAYFVRKHVVYNPECPLYFIAVILTHEWQRFPRLHTDAARVRDALVKGLTELPGQTYIVIITHRTGYPKQRMSAVPGALIYTKSPAG